MRLLPERMFTCRLVYYSDGIVRIRANTVNIGTPTPLDRSRRRQARRASRRIVPLPSNAGKPGEAAGRLLDRPARRPRGVVQKLGVLKE